jgi:hypothetical protein
MIQLLPESAIGDRRPEVFVGCGRDAYLDGNRIYVSDPLKFALFHG